MSKRTIFFSLSLCFLLLACGANGSKQVTDNNTNSLVDYFADNGFGNAVAVVQHPAGIYHEGVTYVCYQGPLEDPYVAAYDHETSKWVGPYRAGVSEMGKDPSRKNRIDNHGKPSMLIDDAGYIHIAFGGHGGMPRHGENALGNHHYGKNAHVVSKKPLDISDWEPLDNIPPFGTYNQFIKMDNGDIYLFYRHGAHRSNWVYQKSVDNGRTFDRPVSFLKHKRRTDQAAEDSWYPWITRGNGNELIVAFDYHLCSDSSKENNNGLGHIAERYNVYYMVFDTETGEWRNVKGDLLNVPVTKEEADSKALVTRTDGNWTFQGVVDLYTDGNPHVGITIGKDIGQKRSGPKSMHHFRWDGTEWVLNGDSGLPVGNGDIAAGTPSKVSAYLESIDEESFGEVGRWESFDGGATFSKADVLLRRENSRLIISSLIDNAHPDARLVVAEKQPGSDYRKMYLLGDNGPLTRPEKEARLMIGE